MIRSATSIVWEEQEQGRIVALNVIGRYVTLGLLIPPSIIMIVYGVTAEVSITRLFIAGVIPGLLLAGLFMAYTVVWSLLNPEKIPPPLPL